MSIMKIQLETEDIIKLLNFQGHDIQLEVTNKIVQEFTKRYLKDIANSQIVIEAKDAILSEVNKEISNQIGNVSIWNRNINQNVKTLIQEFVKEEITKTVKEAVDHEFKIYSEQRLNEYISDRIDYLTKCLVDKKIKEKLDNIVKELDNAKKES